MSAPRTPDFVVIGAMKAGSTTLHEDLRQHPGLHMVEKEQDTLALDDAEARQQYARLIGAVGPEVVVGEVSATYAKLPASAGVAERARRLLPESARIVYLVRNPVDRAVSQHFHQFARGRAPADVDEAVAGDPAIVDYSCYARQIRPWVDLFGLDAVHLVHFETYVADRAATVAQVEAFLGLPERPPGTDLDTVHNQGDERPVAVGRAGRLARSAAYRRVVRPLLSERLRRRAGARLLPAAPPRPAPPSPETVELILARTEPDGAELQAMFGPRAPVWDADATRARYDGLRRAWEART